jgi:hypothetical protein
LRSSITKCAEDEVASPKFDPEELCDAEEPIVMVTDLLIGADGTSRTIANQMQEDDKEERESMNPIQRLFAGKPFTVTRYEDDNQRVYKSVPFNIPKDWRPDLNYSARTEKSRVTMEALPADREGSYCGILLMKKDDPLAAPDVDPAEFRKFFEQELPQFNDLVDDETMASVARKPASFLPGFRYVGPRLNQDDRTVLLGDCAHTVKPYFGLGCNSALEDVVVSSKSALVFSVGCVVSLIAVRHALTCRDNSTLVKRLMRRTTCRTQFICFRTGVHQKLRPLSKYRESWIALGSLVSLLSFYQSFWTLSFISLHQKCLRQTTFKCSNVRATAFVDYKNERDLIAFCRQPSLVLP